MHDLNTLQWDGGTYKGEFLGQPLNGTTVIDPDDFTDFDGKFQKTMRRRIFQTLSTPSTITEKSPADRINDYVNA